MTDIAKLAWISYNFNVLAITGMIYFLLAIMYQRSKRAIINTAETPYKQDNTMLNKILWFVGLAIVWFLVKEYEINQYFEMLWRMITIAWNWLQGVIAGVVYG